MPSPNPEDEEMLIETRRLSNQARDAFLALLDAGPEPTEALKKAAAEYNKGYHVGDVYHFQLPALDADADDMPF